MHPAVAAIVSTQADAIKRRMNLFIGASPFLPSTAPRSPGESLDARERHQNEQSGN
jgi:hypothetical protein